MTSFLLAGLLITCLAPIWMSDGRRDLLSPPVLVGMTTIVMIGLRAFYLQSSDYVGLLGFGGYPLDMREKTLQTSLAVVLLGLASYYVGYSGARKLSPNSLPVFAADWSERRVRAAVGALALVGLISFAFLFARLGSPAAVMRQQHQINLLLAGLGYPYWGAQFLLVGVIIWVAHRTRPTLSTIALGAIAFVGFFVLGRRSNLLILLLPIAVLYHYRVKRIGRARAGVAFVLLLALFNVSFLLRFAGASGVGLAEVPRYVATSLREGYVTTLMANRSEFKLLDVLMLTVRDYPEEYSYESGRAIAEVPLMPIPRRWFPGKPVSYDQRIAERYVPGRIAGLPATAFGRFYMDLGVVGVTLGFVLLGALSRWVFEYRRIHGVNPGAVLVYALFLLFLLDFLRVADYARTLFSWLRLMLPLAGTLYFVAGPPRIPSWATVRSMNAADTPAA